MPIVARAVPGRSARAAAVALATALVTSGCIGTATPAPSGPAPTSPALSGSSGPSAAAVGGCTPIADPASKDWNERVWYEVFVRSFKDGDGDGIGDLKGLTSKLDYLNDGDPASHDDLGIGGIWLMPIMESPSYHGYDVVDYRTVERDYGTNADFSAFLAAAHDRGIKVILDLVINHTSSQHPWFEDALAGGPHRDWYSWSATDPGWPSPLGGGSPWHQGSNGEWFYGAFWEGMPDLNLRNDDATAAVTDVARYWLDLGVDGFRLDAARHLIEDGPTKQANTPGTLAWLERFNAAVEAAKPGALTIGEVWDSSRIAGRYVPDSVDLTFDFDLAGGIVEALRQGRAPVLDTALRETSADWPPNQFGSFLTNHDQNRVMDQLNGDVAAAKLAAFTLLTAPGVPFIYYGEEIGLTGSKPDERIRTPMPWSAEGGGGFTTGTPWEPLAEGWQTANVASERADAGSVLATYRAAIGLRAEHDALRDGLTLVPDVGAEAVIGWLRATSTETLLWVANLSDKPVSDYKLDLAAGPLCGPVSASLLAAVNDSKKIAPVPPVVEPAGGFDDYAPLPALEPRGGYLIALARAP